VYCRVLGLLFALVGGTLSTTPPAAAAEDVGAVTVEDQASEDALVDLTMPVSVVDMRDFHGRNISLNEVLKRVAGVRVKQEGGLGSRTNIAIHGLEGKRVTVFINGRALNAPDGSFGINDIPVQLIERIEVYKGVVPARFGGDALGGAVNVVTRSFNRDYIDLTYAAGSYDTHRATVAFKRRFEPAKIELGIGGFFNRAANDYVMASPYVDGLNIKRDHDAYASALYAASLTLEDYGFDEIELELVRYTSEKEIQGIEAAITAAKRKSRTNLLIADVEKAGFLLPDLDLAYNFMWPHTETNFIDKADTCYNFDGSERTCGGVGGEVTGIPHDSRDTTKEQRHDLNLRYAVSLQHAVNFHLNTQHARYTPDDPLASEALGYDIGAFPSEKTDTVYTLGLESAFLGGKLINDAGIKSYHYDYTVTSQERAITQAPATARQHGQEWGYYESLRLEPAPDLFIKASYEHAYRLPDAEEIFGDGILITSSPGLQPEEADNLNLGLQYARDGMLGTDWGKVDLTLFYRKLVNMIKQEAGTQTLGYVNLGKVEVKGVELELQADLNAHWYIYLNYTHQSLKDRQKTVPGTRDTPNPTYGHDVPNIASQYGNLGLEYKLLGVGRDDALLKLFWEANWVDDYYYGWALSRLQDRKINAHVTQTAGVEYSFYDDSLTLSAEVRNLTDAEVTDVYNFPLMGRTYHLNLRYTLF